MPVALSNLLFHCVIFLIIITLWVSVEHIIEIQFLRCHRTDHSFLFNIQVFRCIIDTGRFICILVIGFVLILKARLWKAVVSRPCDSSVQRKKKYVL